MNDKVINYIDPESGEIKTEKVLGDQLIKWLYSTSSGNLLSHILCRSTLSKLYGLYQWTPISKKKIPQFINEFKIDMSEYLKQDYANFNEFFIRKFKKGKRPFEDNNTLSAFAEGRYFAYNKIDPNVKVPVKEKYLSPKALLGHSKWMDQFQNGPLVICRLCPVDYHRFHFPDEGRVLDYYKISGNFHSVNPLALNAKPNIFITNERDITILDTKNFGKLAYIEVGAMCVGLIKQSHDMERSFLKGDEKGYFLFGASTVIVIGEEGAWLPDEALIKNTNSGLETFTKLGKPIAFMI